MKKSSLERFLFSNGSYQDYPNHTEDETVKIVLKSDHLLEDFNTSNLPLAAKLSRDTAISENISIFGFSWQMRDDAHDIRKVLQDAELIGASVTDTVMFRLADNSWRETTLEDLKLVLAAHIERKRKVWDQFGVWDSGDKTEPFEVIGV